MRTPRAAAAVSVLLLLAACSEEVRGVASPETPPSTPPSSSSPAPVPPPEEQPGAPVPDTGDKSGPATPGGGPDAAGGSLVAGTAFRSDGSSAQVVVNLRGSGVPEWTIAYSDATAPDGGPVDIAGDAFLRLRVRSDSSGEGQGSSRSSVSLGPVAETRTIGGADGYEEVLIGVRGGEQPFSAGALTDPGRIVIEFPG
jgi:hypothetical protein